jgi:uncharacterized protein (TIGR01319 family)
VRVEVLSAEIGSTITVVSAFDGLAAGRARLLGQGFAPTSVAAGDVRAGLGEALKRLAATLGGGELEWDRFSACSSAAGGLRMSVHGLVYEMTVRAAREAALGAGANICQLTAGRMRESDCDEMLAAGPNIILIAGGVDYGERETVLANSRLIRDALRRGKLSVPVIYAGNRENRQELRALFEGSGSPLIITDNVYPRIDELAVGPTRAVIQGVFEKHITRAPGMEHIRQMVDGRIMPVPGAVMQAAQLLKEKCGDLIVFDVGGATTDLHSVCADSPEIGRIMIAPEPEARRSVEGDLGVFLNRAAILSMAGREIAGKLELDELELAQAVADLGPLPATASDKALAAELTFQAAKTALERHAGRVRDLYSVSGKRKYAEGKDLTAVRIVIGTGGALTRLPGGGEILRRVLGSGRGRELYPPQGCRILLDRHYILAAAGVLVPDFPEAAFQLMSESLGEG